MKPKSALRSFLLAAGSSLLAVSSASAQVYWDSNGTTGGFGNLTGVWGTANFWNTDPLGGNAGAFSTATTSSSNVNFGTATLNYNQGTIGVAAGGVLANSITIGAGQTTAINLGTSGGASVTIYGGGITKNNGSGIFTFVGPVILGAAQTWTNNSATVLATGRNLNFINNGGFQLTINGTGNTTFGAGNNLEDTLKGSGALVKDGTGVLFMGGDNTQAGEFTGNVTINGGVLNYGDSIVSLGTGNILINGGVLEARHSNGFTKTQGTGAGQIQITGGVSGFSGAGNTVTFNPGDLVWGSGTFAPTKFVLQSSNANIAASSILTSSIDLGTSARTIVSNQVVADYYIAYGQFNGNITGGSGGSIVKEGIGLHVFNGTNSYTGGTSIDAGTIRFNTIASMPSSGAVAVKTGANLGIQLGSTGQWTTGTSGVGTLGGLLAGVGGAGTSTVTYAGDVGLLVQTTANSSYAGVIANPSGSSALRLIKTGTTALELTGTNTYTGSTTLNQGTLSISAAANLGNASAPLIFGNLGATNNTSSTLRITGTALTSLSGLGRTVTFGTAGIGFDISNPANTFTLNQILNQGTGLFSKDGPGTLVLNQANTYTGNTTVTGGGGLVLDYSAGQDNRKLGTGTLTFTGAGTITLKGGSASTIENVSNNGTALNAGGTFIARDGGTVPKIRLNAITRAAGGTISFADATIADTDTNNFGASGANGILGGWATLGNDWAVSANNGAANTAITAFTGYTTYVSSGGVATTNYLLNGAGTVSGVNTIGTVKITDSGSSQALALGGNDLTITSTSATALGGIMYAGGTTNSYSITSSTGRIVTSTANQELIFAVQTGDLSVGALIGASGSTGPVTKSGAGRMEISSNNNFTGAVRVNEGVLRLANANATGTNGGGIIVQNAAALELTGGLTFIGDALTITGNGVSSGGALRNVSGTNTYQGAITIGNGGGRINADTSTTLNVRGITTALNADVTFGGAGNISHSTTAISGQGGVIKDGAGTLTLSVTNSYTGATTVSAGKLLINGSTSSTSLVSVAAAGTLGGSGTVGGHTTISGTHSPGNSPGIITHSGNLTYEAGANVLWELVANSTASRGTNFDGINVGATLDFNGATTLNLNFNFGASAVEWNDTFWASSYTGTAGWLVYSGATTLTDFGNLSLNAPSAWLDENGDTLASARTGASFSLFQSGNNIYLNYSAVPEPRAALLGGIGLLLLLRRRRS